MVECSFSASMANWTVRTIQVSVIHPNFHQGTDVSQFYPAGDSDNKSNIAESSTLYKSQLFCFLMYCWLSIVLFSSHRTAEGRFSSFAPLNIPADENMWGEHLSGEILLDRCLIKSRVDLHFAPRWTDSFIHHITWTGCTAHVNTCRAHTSTYRKTK